VYSGGNRGRVARAAALLLSLKYPLKFIFQNLKTWKIKINYVHYTG
jgi:hypothetical protein